MRKPDPEPVTFTGMRKRLSTSTKPPSQPQPDPTSRSSPPPAKKRSIASTNVQTQMILPADDPEPRSSFETVPAPPKRNQSQAQEIKSRPAPDSPPLQPLHSRSSSRPASSSFRPISSSHAYVTTTTAASSSSTVKRKKSRPYVDPDDFGSDGTQADAEYGGLTNGWVSVEGRRKSVPHSGASSSRERKLDVDDGRRHGMAV